MKHEAADRGDEKFRSSREESNMTDQLLAEIDTLIERSSLGTEDAKSLRYRTPIEAVQPIVDRANNLNRDPVAIGIEILPDQLSGVLTDHYGVVLGHRRWSLPDMEVGTVVNYVAKVARDLAITSLGLDLPHPCIGIGLQLGGPVDTSTGTVIFYKNNPTDPTSKPHRNYEWVNVKLAELVEEETGCRAVLENDANAFAIREQKFGVGHEFATYAVVLIRDGVGCSMVVDNKLLSRPLELGHIVVRPGGRTCECGQIGDIESQAGRRAIRAVVREEAGTSADLEWQAAIQLARGEDDQADKALLAFERAGDAIAHGVATLVTLLNPPCVVIYAPDELIESGKNSRVADTFKRAVDDYSQYTFPQHRRCDIVTRPLRLTTGALGAALIALHRLFSVRLASTPPNWSAPDDLPAPSPRRESPSRQAGNRT